MHTSYHDIAERAKTHLSDFKTVSNNIPYEEKGVLYSEILFMLACLQGSKPRRILESGRARGQSTLLLARALPNTEILSIEYDEDSPDVPVAEQRLREYKNVQLLFGDARVMLPRLVQEGDVVIIDGPKMFLAIRLALVLLATKKVPHVFVHDVGKETPERRFLDWCMPECRFSDNRVVAEVTHAVDNDAVNLIPAHQRFNGFLGEYGYGFSLGAISYIPGRSYRLLWLASILYDLYGRVTRKFSPQNAERKMQYPNV